MHLVHMHIRRAACPLLPASLPDRRCDLPYLPYLLYLPYLTYLTFLTYLTYLIYLTYPLYPRCSM